MLDELNAAQCLTAALVAGNKDAKLETFMIYREKKKQTAGEQKAMIAGMPIRRDNG